MRQTFLRSSTRLIALCAALLLLRVSGTNADAGVIQVVNNNDSGPGSLRQAISDAASGDEIQFHSGLAGATITLGSPLLFSQNLTITGLGADQLTISGGDVTQAFLISGIVSVTIQDLRIANGRSSNYGGGIYITQSTLTLINTVISGNNSALGAGGIFNDEGNLTLLNSVVSGNSAGEGSGGGIFSTGPAGSVTTIINSTISGNHAHFGGGIVLAVETGVATIINSVISENTARSDGGGIHGYRPVTLINSTVANNRSQFGSGGGIWLRLSGVATVENSIFWGNTPDQLFSPGTIRHSNIQGSGGSGGWTHPQATDGGGNIDADPLFDADLRLQAGSPSLNSGDTSLLPPDTYDVDGDSNVAEPIPLDRDGNARVAGASVDMGAFERPEVTLTQTTVSAATGQYSDTVTLSALVSPNTAPGSIEFFIDGVSAGIAAVSGGAATLDYTIELPAAVHVDGIKGVFTSTDAAYGNSEGLATLTVQHEDASVTPDGANPSAVQVDSPGAPASSITVKATIEEWQDGAADELGDICLAVPVTVTLKPVVGGGSLSVPASVSCDGTTLEIEATFNNVPVNVYEVVFSVGGDYYTGSASSALAVYDPSLGFVTGGGKIDRGNGVWGEFAANVKYLKKGVQGGVLYIEHRADGDVKVKSNSMQTLSIVDNAAVITAKATVAEVGNHKIQAVLVDNGEPGVGADQFSLTVWSSSGSLVSELTFGPELLVEGNIQVPHKSRRK